MADTVLRYKCKVTVKTDSQFSLSLYTYTFSLNCMYVMWRLISAIVNKAQNENAQQQQQQQQYQQDVFETVIPVKSDTSDKTARPKWGGKIQFVFTILSYAIGLGNVWRFPYLCYRNGGGAFLIPYGLMLAFIGIPFLYMELSLGQYSGRGPITLWEINPLLKGLGYAMIMISWIISIYYIIIIAQALYYLAVSLTAVLPWTFCNNAWNTDDCLTVDSATVNGTVTYANHSTTPTEEFYKNRVLEQSEGIDDYGTVLWHLALALLIAWVIVRLVLLKGIRSLGKVSYFTAIFPYMMLLVFFFRGVTLPGAGQGLAFYFKPDFARLADPRVWNDAATQIFYSLGVCSGGPIAMASYNRFKNNVYRDALMVSLVNACTSVFAGMVIFSILGFMAYEKGTSVEDVATSGPGLVFVAYPEAISRMPVAPLWSTLFFLMLAVLGFGSQFAGVEVVLSAITDEFPQYLRPKINNIVFRTVAIGVSFLLGLPLICNGGMYMLNLIDYSIAGFPLLILGLLEIVAIMWVYGSIRFSENIYEMIGIRPGRFWKICWKYVAPLIIVFVLLFNMVMYKEPSLDDVHYPEWALSLGWMISLGPLAVILAWFLYGYCRKGGYEVMMEEMEPLEGWGPAKTT